MLVTIRSRAERRSERRKQKRAILQDITKDLDTVEKAMLTASGKSLAGLEVLHDILYANYLSLISSEV